MPQEYQRVDGEVLVNTTTTGTQEVPDIALLLNGGFVVVWADSSGTGGDASPSGIKAQLFDADGRKIGGEFLVNTATANAQSRPVVTTLANGQFVVTWHDSSREGGDTSEFGIKAQIFNADGSKSGSEFLVNTVVSRSQRDPEIAALEDGGFVITWADQSGVGTLIPIKVKARIYDVSGNPVGDEIALQADQHGTDPDIAALSNGGFAISWTGPGSNSLPTTRVQIFDASGAKIGSAINVETQLAGEQSSTSIAALQSGFVVTWVDNSQADDPSDFGVKAQLFDASGNKVGGEILVNTVTDDVQRQARVDALPDGGFIVTWAGPSSIGATNDVRAQIFDASGTKVGSEFVIHAGSVSDQSSPRLAVTSSGDVIVVWADSSGVGGDASGFGVKYQILAPAGGLESDDFLTGTSGPDTLEGGDGNDELIGNGGSDRLDGGAGNDLLDGGPQSDTMSGRDGDDIYIVDTSGDRAIEFTDDDGIDTVRSSVDFTLGARIENLELTGTAIFGTGNDLANSIVGNAQDNILNGWTGADTLSGGNGNDTYIVDHAGDVVIETSGAGIDIVHSTVDFALGDHVENLVLDFPNYGVAPVFGTGNALDNRITGHVGDNALDGAGGADIMEGGIGNDTYFVDNVGDQVIETGETSGIGIDYIDTVNSSISYTLGDHVEKLVLVGSAAINGTGNSLDNRITGNAAANVLDGRAGADTMIGGAGDDIYHGDTSVDQVIEEAVGGIDTLITSVSRTIAIAHLENLTLVGSAANGFGNTLDNVITGNAVANLLRGDDGNDSLSGGGANDALEGGAGNDLMNGGVGADTMTGGTGNDSYVVNDSGDRMNEAAGGGTDLISSSITLALGTEVENLVLTGTTAVNGTGNELANSITGNAANNLLRGLAGNDTLEGGAGTDIVDGGTGADAMRGGLGNDTFVVDTADDSVIEEVAQGLDRVVSSISYNLGANLENLTLSGTGVIDGTGNALGNLIIGNAAANILDGGLGADRLQGGGGNDSYVVDSIRDKVSESGNAGTDVVLASVDYSLASNIENLTLTGSADIDATGNSLANTITGNAGANRLNGGGGADVMRGGTGNDIYYVDHAADQAVENAGEGIDTVRTKVSFTLATNVENLILIGTTAVNGTGNTLNNVITGNSAANILDGDAGADRMKGGAGNDTYVVDNAGDQVEENASDGTDTVQSSLTFTLGSHVEHLTLTGGSAINGTGNTLANTVTGNGAANLLAGGLGNDTLVGNGGADTLRGGAGLDTLSGGTAADNFTFDTALSAANLDHVTDFVSGTDEIVLENAVFTGLAAGALNANAFRLGAAAQDADDRILYDAATGRLYFDADGNGAGAAVHFATLDNLPATLAASDFTVI